VTFDALCALVNAQAEDEGLWCVAGTIQEAYVQRELRRLHAAIEAVAPSSLVAPREDRVDAAAAALLIELAFLVPPGTDLRTHPIAQKLTDYKKAIEERAAGLAGAREEPRP
jgi:hypothetical protein